MLTEEQLLDAIADARRGLGRYRGVVEADDLHQLAALGVVTAARRFDPARGVRFSTFAARHAVGAVRHYVRDALHLFPGRRGTVWPEKVSLESWGRALPAPDGTTEERVALLDALARLPAPERAAQVEAARRLGCSQRHVSRLLARGLARLRAGLCAR